MHYNDHLLETKTWSLHSLSQDVKVSTLIFWEEIHRIFQEDSHTFDESKAIFWEPPLLPSWVVSRPIDQHLSTELLGSKVCLVCLVCLSAMAKDHSMPWHWHHTSAKLIFSRKKKHIVFVYHVRKQLTQPTNPWNKKLQFFFGGGLDGCFGWKKQWQSTRPYIRWSKTWGSKLKPVRSPTHWV